MLEEVSIQNIKISKREFITFPLTIVADQQFLFNSI